MISLDQFSEEALLLNCCDFVRTCCHCENIYNLEVEVEEPESTNNKHTHAHRQRTRVASMSFQVNDDAN